MILRDEVQVLKSIPLDIKKRIVYLVMRDNNSIHLVAQRLGMKIDIVRKYIDLVTVDVDEQIKVLPVELYKKILNKKNNIQSKFTGYFTEMPEMEIGETPHYAYFFVKNEIGIILEPIRESFSERLQMALEEVKDTRYGYN